MYNNEKKKEKKEKKEEEVCLGKCTTIGPQYKQQQKQKQTNNQKYTGIANY